MLVAGGATARSNRVLCLSSSAGFGLAAGTCSSVNTKTGAISPGTLKNTPVNPGGKTATMVIVRNDDTQTLNHVTLAGGDVADNLPYNAIGPRPLTTKSLNGMTLAKVIPQDGSDCGTPTTTGFMCEIGTLTPGQSASFLIVIQAPGTAGSTAWWITADFNEGWSTTGTNADYTFATGSVDVSNASCAAGAANFFLPGGKFNLDSGVDSNAANCGNQNANIQSVDNLAGNGGFTSLAVDGKFAVPCPTAYKNKCYGKTVSASALGGTPVPGGMQWTITWYGINHLTGVFHFGDSYPTDLNDYVAIPLTSANKCADADDRDCWSNIVTSTGGAAKFITVTFVTDENGKGAGW
jgi:hypothetical protein